LFLISRLAARPALSDAATALPGLSDHGTNPTQPYVTAGDRAYLIGTQDGGFPDLGWHVPGEMAGLWVHPIKMIDGFWATAEELIHSIFGIEPDGPNKSIVFDPDLPTGWNSMSIENLPVGADTVSFSVAKTANPSNTRSTRSAPIGSSCSGNRRRRGPGTS